MNDFDRLANIAQINASLQNMRENMDMRKLAKEILCEEDYTKFIKSYKFTFWFQLIGILAGFAVPSIILLVVFKDTSFLAFGAAIGILWMCIWLPLSLLIPPTKIYRKFAKWYRSRNSSIDELNIIFYHDK